jgi:hypothetical protein
MGKPHLDSLNISKKIAVIFEILIKFWTFFHSIKRNLFGFNLMIWIKCDNTKNKIKIKVAQLGL